MPLDGAFINCLRAELQSAVDCHIDKIYLPAKNEFVITLRGRGVNKKLYISINPENPRVNFTEQSFENPPVPPMLCMLLRKHLSGGRLVSVEGLGAERLIIFKILATNELGDRVNYSLIVELLGHKTNLILTNENGKILDAARRSDIETAERIIAPGAIYCPPETDDRVDFLNGDLEKAAELCAGTDLPLSTALLKNIAGISPLICREIAHRISGDTDLLAKNIAAITLYDALNEFKNAAKNGGVPYVIIDKEGNFKDFSFTEIKQYEATLKTKRLETFSLVLETFYNERDNKRRLEHLKGDILKLLNTLISRNSKKLLLRKEELKRSEKREDLRVFGELIKANLYRINKGDLEAIVENYYDEECTPVKIKLDHTLSPQQNAAKYFKEYKKACTAAATLTGLISECETESEYLESVLFATENCENPTELREIRAELKENGYIKAKKGEAKNNKKMALRPLMFEKNGFKIAVGRNNLQNDQLTLKTASKNDIWFHTKNIHGSHVILFTEGKVPDDETLLFTARLAARYSKAKNSSQVPVDYTPVKFVKKPVGSKPGMVIYKTNQTIFVNPNDLSVLEED